METSKELRQKVAQLESWLDQAESELGYLNQLLQRCGFPQGVQTLKKAVEDLLAGIEVEPEDFLPPESSPPTQSPPLV